MIVERDLQPLESFIVLATHRVNLSDLVGQIIPTVGDEIGQRRVCRCAIAAHVLIERELEVLRLIALGHTNNEIAEQLYLSVRTVESHRAHIQQKLAMTTRSELVRYAIDRGLIDV